VKNPANNEFSILQDFNRYSYVRNNPLRYTDPSGYLGTVVCSGCKPEDNSARSFASGERETTKKIRPERAA
jgi:hypothetical protein